VKPHYLSGGVHIVTDVYKPTGPANNAAIILAYFPVKKPPPK
jgi:hypothetical protein